MLISKFFSYKKRVKPSPGPDLLIHRPRNQTFSSLPFEGLSRHISGFGLLLDMSSSSELGCQHSRALAKAFYFLLCLASIPTWRQRVCRRHVQVSSQALEVIPCFNGPLDTFHDVYGVRANRINTPRYGGEASAIRAWSSSEAHGNVDRMPFIIAFQGNTSSGYLLFPKTSYKDQMLIMSSVNQISE